jgi:DNA-directed RNA polymerase subunit RPC12/RpoP
MGKCPNCGNKGVFLKTVNCKTCGKEGCEKCFIYLLSIYASIWDKEGYGVREWEKWYACSDQCLETFARKLQDQISLKDVSIHTSEDQIKELCLERGVESSANKEWISSGLAEKIANLGRKHKDEYLVFSFGNLDSPDEANPLNQRLMEHASELLKSAWLAEAENLEKARRFEEAARIYEKYAMYEEAGRARAEREEILVKRTEVSVDLNNLLQQLKDGGIVATYRCPHCGGELKVDKDTNVESLKHCEHCGSEIEAMDLADFLRTALS